MPRPLLYAQFEDSKYTPQFVGSIYPELKEAQQVLNQRYDTAQDQDSKTAAALTDLLQNTAEKDLPQARAVYDQYLAKLEDRAKSGRYEAMLPDTVQDARKFNVNATKFVAEKKRIDDYLKRLDENKEISNSEKARLRQMAMSNQASLQFNPKTGAVEGQGFREDAFAKDVNLDQWANKMSEGFIPDQTSWNGGKFVREKDGSAEGRLMFIERGGTKREVKPQDVRAYVSDIAKSDSDVQGYLDRLTKQAIHEQGGDWRNPDPQQYQEVRAQIEEKALSPTMRAMGNKFGFRQTQTDYKAQFDPLDMYKKKLSLGSQQIHDENQRQTIPSTTKQEDLKNVDLTELTKDRVVADDHSGVDPLGMNTSYKKVKGKSISELANEAENGLPKYPGLNRISNLAPKGEKESEHDYAKRLNPLYKSYQSKIKTHQAYQEDLSAEAKQYTDMIFGQEVGEGKEKGRSGGGYFANEPIWIEQGGKFTKYENGLQALQEGAISQTDLNKFSVTGINHNYGDFGGSFEAVGKIGDKPAKIFVGGSVEHRKYSEPLSLIENVINSGETSSFQTKLLTRQGELPVEITVEPLKEGKYSINKNGEFANVEPQVTIQYPDGHQETLDYKVLKEMMVKSNPYKDPVLNKQRSNQGRELFKDVTTRKELGY